MSSLLFTTSTKRSPKFVSSMMTSYLCREHKFIVVGEAGVHRRVGNERKIGRGGFCIGGRTTIRSLGHRISECAQQSEPMRAVIDISEEWGGGMG